MRNLQELLNAVLAEGAKYGLEPHRYARLQILGNYLHHDAQVEAMGAHIVAKNFMLKAKDHQWEP